MAATAAFINTMLDAGFSGSYTIKLFRTNLPSAGGVEVSGGGYTALSLSFSSATARKKTAAQVTFTNLPTSQTIVAFGVYSGATLIDEGVLASPYTADLSTNELKITYEFEIGA